MEDNCFVLHPEKQPSSALEKVLEVKIGTLGERIENLASSSQILDPQVPSRVYASSFTLDYYMLGTSREVVSSATVTRAQSVSRATPPTTEGSIDNLRAQGNGPTDQIGQGWL